MIYPVSYLIREELLPSDTYSFTVEDNLTVKFLMNGYLTFHNSSCDDCELRIQYLVASSGVFSDTFTPVDTAVAKNTIYSYEFKLPLIQQSRYTTHTVRMTNNDSSSRTLYCLITGWTDTKTTYPGTVYSIGFE